MSDMYDSDEFWNEDPVTCKYCGASGFEWTKTVSGWRLRDMYSGEEHKCKVTKGIQNE